ncbi:MAG: NAD(+) diphosphatase [Actinobacteria bacterium]|nr:NAD(+) diphosphatase [Actinomycetota bacterium]
MRRPNYFASRGFDRAGHRRQDPEWMAGALRHPDARVLLLRRAEVALDPAQRLVQVAAWEGLVPDHGLVFLGEDADGAPVFCVDVGVMADAEEASGADAFRFVDLRGAAMVLPEDEANRAAYASAMLTWHARHRFCGACGEPTTTDWAGHVRRCPGCGAEHFPRTDPVIIVLCTAGDSCLLGRQRIWPPQMWSALAGFVEPGESLEDAVRREVMEEAGVLVAEPVYHSSQPWPFPMSLMLGFHAPVGDAPTEVVVDTNELEDARWFGRDELTDAVADGGVMLPPPFSIARQLVDSWLGT